MQEGKRRVLLVEDEPNLAFNIEYNLQAEGFEVIVAHDGKQALDAYRLQGPFSLILMDVMLPEINGFELTKMIREEDRRTQILMLTARAAENDIIHGLEYGADDYMTKPFSFKELLLRVRRMADRSELYGSASEPSSAERKILKFGPVRWNPDSLELSGPSGTHVLTVLEAKVLEAFLNSPNQVLSRKYLLSTVWGLSENVETRTVDNFVMRLRKYIEQNPSQPEYLKSVRGRGYKFSAKIETMNIKEQSGDR